MITSNKTLLERYIVVSIPTGKLLATSSVRASVIDRFFIEILLATADYDRFYFLMMSEAQKYRENETGNTEEDGFPRK